MAFCPHGNLPSTCEKCRANYVLDAERRAALNRARGESKVVGRIDDTDLPYPWQRSAFEAWRDGGKGGLVALSPGLPLGDTAFAAIGEVVNTSPTTNVLVACPPADVEAVRKELAERFDLQPTSLLDHHFLEPRDDGTLVVADLQELETVPLSTWGRFASTGILVVLDADGVNAALGQLLVDSPFRYRFSLSRQPSAVDLLATRPWSRAFGPLLFRATEDQARDLGVLPRIHYRLHVEMLRPEAGRRAADLEGPWEATDIPTRIPPLEAGPLARSRARDVAIRAAKETPGLIVVHEGVPVPGATATVRLHELADKYDPQTAGWVLASPSADAKAILRIATVAFRTLGKPGRVEDAVVLPVPADLCKVPPWNPAWRSVATQIDRVVAGLLLAENPGDAMSPEDLESLVGVALALRGHPADELYRLTPIVAEAAARAHARESVLPERVAEVSRAVGGLAASLLVAAELGPLHLLRIAHPRFTPVEPDLPHPSLYDARRHAWRGRAFAALAAAAAKSDLVTAWGRYPELRFVFPSSALLEASTAYCARHKLKGPLDGANLKPVPDKTRIAGGDREQALGVLQEWNNALGLAEEHERDYLADMHARQPERERRREGVALPNLRFVEKSADTMTLEAVEGRLPNTNMAPGSEVALVEQGGREELARGLVSKISSRRVTIEFPAGAPRHRLPPRLTLNLVFDAKIFEAYHTAVYGALRAMSGNANVDDGPDGLLRAALLGETDPPAEIRQKLEGGILTPSQREAIEQVLSGGRVRLIHGPPGTGKTHTLVHLAMALAQAGHSVLVTADSNAAVDNLVVGMRRNGFLAVRIGHAPNIRDEAVLPARIDPIDAPLFVRWAAGQGIVVATTNYGAFRYIDAKGGLTPYIFDYVIHDEAGQATAPSSLAAVLRGRRLVLAGDPKQLPPTVVAMDAKEAGLDVTLFERIEQLTGPERTRLLSTQFRMREPIIAFSNGRYYEGRLETDPAAAAQDGLAELPAAAFQHVTGRENERQRNGSISNDFEVDAVAALVEAFTPQLRERNWTMAVLTPYQAQREQLRRRLPDLEVSTVDGAQGREWDVVLYSTVRSNPQHRLGFLEDERRLNVAVTRAKRNFILVGDERTLGDNDAFGELLGRLEKVRLYFPPQPGHGHRDDRRDDRRDGDRRERARRFDDERARRDDRGPRRDDRGPRGDRQPRQDRPPQPAREPKPKPIDFPWPFLGPRKAIDEELKVPEFKDPLEAKRPKRKSHKIATPTPTQAPMVEYGRRPERRAFTIGEAPAAGGSVVPATSAAAASRTSAPEAAGASQAASPVASPSDSPVGPPAAAVTPSVPSDKPRKPKAAARVVEIPDEPVEAPKKVVKKAGKTVQVTLAPEAEAIIAPKKSVKAAKVEKPTKTKDEKAAEPTPKASTAKAAKPVKAEVPAKAGKKATKAAAKKPAKVEIPDDGICTAVTKAGTRCKSKAVADGLCGKHA